jgi:hypothetical protein
VPIGVNLIGLQLGYFASYIFLFCLGIAAWRHDWLGRLNWKHARSRIIALPVAWPSMPALGALAIALSGPGKSNFSGSLSLSAIFYALWEPFVAWGMIAAWLLVFRRQMNVRHLDVVESPILLGLHHPPGRAGGHQPAASRLGRCLRWSNSPSPASSRALPVGFWPIRSSGCLACGGLSSPRIRGSARCRRPLEECIVSV